MEIFRNAVLALLASTATAHLLLLNPVFRGPTHLPDKLRAPSALQEWRVLHQAKPQRHVQPAPTAFQGLLLASNVLQGTVVSEIRVKSLPANLGTIAYLGTFHALPAQLGIIVLRPHQPQHCVPLARIRMSCRLTAHHVQLAITVRSRQLRRSVVHLGHSV